MTLKRNLGKVEQKILFALEKNARQSNSKISKDVGIPKHKVNYHIKKFESNGTILGYYPIIDVSKLGYITYRCYLHLRDITEEKKQEILNYLKNTEEVAYIYTYKDYYLLGVGIVTKSTKRFHEVWDKIMLYKPNIESYKISIYSPIYDFTKTFLNPDKTEIPEINILGEGKEEKVDEIDLKILKSLAKNAKKTTINIAKEIEQSPQLIIQRIKKLEQKNIILGYKPILNWSSLGYESYKATIILKNYKCNQDIFNFCHTEQYIFQLNRPIGSDLEIELYVKNHEQFKGIMTKIQNLFPNQIEKYEHIILEKAHKVTYIPTN